MNPISILSLLRAAIASEFAIRWAINHKAFLAAICYAAALALVGQYEAAGGVLLAAFSGGPGRIPVSLQDAQPSSAVVVVNATEPPDHPRTPNDTETDLPIIE